MERHLKGEYHVLLNGSKLFIHEFFFKEFCITFEKMGNFLTMVTPQTMFIKDWTECCYWSCFHVMKGEGTFQNLDRDVRPIFWFQNLTKSHFFTLSNFWAIFWASQICSYFSWLHVIIMSRTRFRVNPHSIVAWMSRNSLLEAGTKSEV